MSGKKSKTSKDKANDQAKSTSTEVAPESQEESITVESEVTPTPAPDLESGSAPVEATEPVDTPALTIEDLYTEMLMLREMVLEHSTAIIELQQTTARKRKPVASNGKIQIRDKQTGTVYPSKNNAYQSLLKAGELKELVDIGVFGAEPSKNTFGWYTLVKEWPDRFEEVQEAQNTQ
ncbi:hypothetical protein ACFLXY_04890 [Chloroflexota bacterium]